MRPDAPRDADKPVAQLLRDLGDELTTLGQEIELAKIELAQKGKVASAFAEMFSAGALAGLGAFGALTACIIAALALALPLWAAALIVAVGYGIAALVLAQSAKKKLLEAAPLVLEQTVQSVKEDIEWAKTRAKSGVR